MNSIVTSHYKTIFVFDTIELIEDDVKHTFTLITFLSCHEFICLSYSVNFIVLNRPVKF